jgi:hypothetical protein
MRVALCFYGLVGSRLNKNGEGEDLDPEIAFNYYNKNILKHNEVDVFIHTWSTSHKKKLIKLYSPKNSKFQNQKDFFQSKDHKSVKNIEYPKNIKNLLIKFFFRKEYHKRLENIKKSSFRAHSRWFSSKMSIELMKSYETKNNFTYDYVMITRLDIGFFKKIQFKKLDLRIFYAGYRNNAPSKLNSYRGDYNNEYEGEQFNDLWFISNSKNIKKFSKLYDCINKYDISPHVSSYMHTVQYIKPYKIKYILYRWFDYELIRRKNYGSKK